MLKQATANAGELFAQCNSRNRFRVAPLGLVKEGAWADVLIYNANPLDDINVVVDYKTHLKVVIKNGTIFKNDL